MSTGRQVFGWGSLKSRLIEIGEAPGPVEERFGEPFVGPSGKRQAEWWRAVGLTRTDFYIDNVCQFRPPDNKADAWDQATWESWMADLHQRLALLEDPWLIVPTGNYSLYALTGKGKVPWHTRDGKEPRAGITDWRGSILSYTDLKGRTIKVIPTIHPAATWRQPAFEPLCRRDWVRIAEERHTKAIDTPRRRHVIAPTIDECECYLSHVQGLGEGDILFTDIENPPDKGTYPIICVGFADTPDYSITIPTMKSYWKDDKKLEKAWSIIDIILCLTWVAKGAHNLAHERYWLLHEQGMTPRNLIWDTMFMHHCLDPSAPHDLASCASFDTREPFWKHEAKDPEDQRKYTSNLSAFLTYNGKDCCVPVELFWIYYDRLAKQVRETSEGPISGLDFYLLHYAELFEPLFQLGEYGVRVDPKRRAEQYAKLVSEVKGIREQIEGQGLDLYGKKGLSPKKLKTWLYETLKFPKQMRKRQTGTKTESADEVAIRKLLSLHQNQKLIAPEIVEVRQQFSEVGPWLLDARRKAKLAEFYHENRVDADGRFRSRISLNTEAGRTNAKKTEAGTGGNQQNVDREVRDMFLADEGKIGLQVDLSQAEGRVCLVWLYNLIGKHELLEQARARPDEYDMHTHNAQRIFKGAFVEGDSKQRYFAKKVVHGAQRNMSGQKMSDEASKDGYTLDPVDCDKAIAAYFEAVPMQAFFQWVRSDIVRQKRLVDTWGGLLDFTYDRLDDEAYRRGFSFRMQPEVARIMNQWGFKPLAKQLADSKQGQINVHAHDGLFISIEPDLAYDCALFLQDHLERPRKYGPTELIIPCEFSLGNSWKASHSWKRLPERAEFDQAVKEILHAEPETPR